MTTDWKTGEFTAVPPECLECIKQVTLAKDGKTTVDGCIEHQYEKDVLKTLHCGPFGITKEYYETCRRYDTQNMYIWPQDHKDCALNSTCALRCTKLYVESPEANNCHRRDQSHRTCSDFGLIHLNGLDACSSSHPDITFDKAMYEKLCGLNKEPVPLVAIIVPIVVVLVLAAALAALLCRFCRLRKKTSQSDVELNAASIKGFTQGLSKGDSGIGLSFDYESCHPDVRAMLRDKKIDIEHLYLGEVIGKGQFGTVRRATLLIDEERNEKIMVAVKMLKTGDIKSDDIHSVLHEALIMHQFTHPNILNLTGIVWKAGDPPLIVLPYMGKGSLLDLVRKPDLKFSSEELLGFAVQIASGLEYLESLKFIHRDVALRNCLVSDYFVVKLGDFGLSRDVYDTGVYKWSERMQKKFDITEVKLPWKWLALESLRDGTFTHKSDAVLMRCRAKLAGQASTSSEVQPMCSFDWWSFGVLLWELFNAGRSPYPTLGNISILQECLEAGYRLPKPSDAPYEVYTMMKQMWDASPEKRPSFSHIHYSLNMLTDTLNGDVRYNYAFSKRQKEHKQGLEAFEQSTASDNSQYADYIIQE